MPNAQNAQIAPPLSVTVVMATTGRAEIARQTIAHMASLGDRPDRVVVSVAQAADFPAGALAALPFPLTVLTGPKGSGLQRNAALEAETDAGVWLFLDDDFLVAEGYFNALRTLFADQPGIVMATGRVIADGLRGPGYDHAAGLRFLAAAPSAPPAAPLRDVYSAYGCNMAVRGATLAAHPERFDPALPLYAWLEDLDFSRRMARYGRIVEDARLRGVHLATKIGRSSGTRLGYSQIANPLYLVRKGTLAPWRAGRIMAGNILSNLARSLWPEPWIDRRGRLRGNLLAFADLLRGRCAPARILAL